MLIDGDATAVVLNDNRVVLGNGHMNGVAKARQRLVDRVIHHLAHKVMQALHTGVANVHRGALAHCLKAFEHLNVMRRILLLFLLFSDFFVCHKNILFFLFA